MPNIIKSFSVGASVHQGTFAAVILKFKFTNDETLLTAWDIDACMQLIGSITQYIEQLDNKGIAYDGDAVADLMDDEGPELSQEEVESATVNNRVSNLAKLMDSSGNLTLSIFLPERSDVVVQPNYAEWIYGYVANTVEEYDASGKRKES